MLNRIPSISSFADSRLRAPAETVSSPSLIIAYWLKRDIIRGVFEPNERLKVEPLTRYYNAGISPVREAILFLAASGLVVHEHQKGHRVAPVSLADYRDSIDIYDRIRRMALAMAMERGGAEWEEAAVVQLHRSRKIPHALPDDDHEARERWQRAYVDLHEILVSGCRSQILIEAFGDLLARVERYTNLFADQSSDRLRRHADEHDELVEALLARDSERVNRLIDLTNESAAEMRRSTIAALKSQ